MQNRILAASKRAFFVVFTGMLIVVGVGCGLDEISDQISVVETVPAPSGIAAAHRISRELGLGADAEQVDSGTITDVTIRVVGPDGADLFPFAHIQIDVVAGGARETLAQGTNFQLGETSRALAVEYSSDIKPFLAAEDFSLQWSIIYKTAGSGEYPRGGIELQTVVGFDIDIDLL